MSKTFAYIRVSTQEQKEDRQLDALKALNVDEVVIEKASGKNFIGREKYQNLKKCLRAGDTLIVHSIDRLGRNYTDICKEWDYLNQQGVYIQVLDMPILNTKDAENDVSRKLIKDIVLKLLSYVAEKERENISRRQREGIKAAQERGVVTFGRPKLKSSNLPKAFKKAYELYSRKEIKAQDAINMCKLKRATFYNYVKLMKGNT